MWKFQISTFNYFSPECGIVEKSSIFVAQKATAPENGVEFRQSSIGTIRSSLAMSYCAWQRRQFSTNQRPRNYLTLTDTESTYCQALLYEQGLQKQFRNLFLGSYDTKQILFLHFCRRCSLSSTCQYVDSLCVYVCVVCCVR